jgi:hypothetical protein
LLHCDSPRSTYYSRLLYIGYIRTTANRVWYLTCTGRENVGFRNAARSPISRQLFRMRFVFALVPILVSGLVSGLDWQRNAVQPQDPPILDSAASGSKELYPLPEGFKIEPGLDMSQPPRTPGAKYVKIRQGPYEVAANTTRPGEFIIVLEKPCKNCFITAIQGGLEFGDGTPAHVNHGAVLQHLTIYNGNVRDLVCQSWKIPLPNRVYATGNEREVARVNPGGSKFGLNMTPEDWYSSRFELMNNGPANMTVYVTQVRTLEPVT